MQPESVVAFDEQAFCTRTHMDGNIAADNRRMRIRELTRERSFLKIFKGVKFQGKIFNKKFSHRNKENVGENYGY